MKFAIIRFPGTWSDRDCHHVLHNVMGREADILWHRETSLDGYDAVVLPGGFSYGDYLRCGAIARFSPAMEAVVEFANRGGPVIGICNGFQVLTRTGLLPGALGHNASGHFQCEWVRLAVPASRSVWTHGLADGAVEPIECPIAHGEGRYVHPDVAALAANDQVALRYAISDNSRNPNGSVDDIAGVCDESGVVLGLMPHPENHVLARQHPRRTRGTQAGLGLALFEQGVRYAKGR